MTAAAAAGALSAVLPASAEARTPPACWRAVVTDWANGGIDRRHSARCYRSALNSLPNDLRTYTTAEDDIRRAMLDEIRNVRGASRATAATRVRRATSSTADENITPERTRSLQGRGGSARGVPTATTTADAQPPLRAVVAAGFALLLVLAAGLGKYLRRRRPDPQSPA